VGINFIRRLFEYWKSTPAQQYVTFSECVKGIDGIVFSTLEERIDALFDIHDADRLEELGRELVIQLSESLLFLLRLESVAPSEDADIGDSYLASVSGLLSRCLTSNAELGCDGMLFQFIVDDRGGMEYFQTTFSTACFI
jgi:hypothetical protein